MQGDLRTLPENQCRYMFECMVAAVRHMHSLDWVHHDLKLCNFAFLRRQVCGRRQKGSPYLGASRPLHKNMQLSVLFMTCCIAGLLSSTFDARQAEVQDMGNNMLEICSPEVRLVQT